MANELIPSKFELPKGDPKKTWGTIMTLIILGGLALLFYIYVLPFLLSVVWGTVQLVIGIAVPFVLLMILTSAKCWRGIRYCSEAIA